MGCNFSLTEPHLNLQETQTTSLEPLPNKINFPSSTNHISTSACSTASEVSPKAHILSTLTKVKGLQERQSFLKVTETTFDTSSSQIQKTDRETNKVALKDQIFGNLGRTFKYKAHATFSKEAFDNDYVFLERIGKGGEGEAHKVFHKPTNHYRVVKVMNKPSENSNPANLYKNLLREANLLVSLDHPNIVKAHEILKDEEHAAMVLEYIEGKSLLEHLNNPLFQSYEAIATIMEQLFSALAYLHSRGVIHKDLKLENILFEKADPFSNLKLIDFGYSEMKDKAYTRTSSGTVMYMASEVFTMNYNEKCDIWAAGVILYLLFFKELPFNGKTSDDIVDDIFNKDLTSFFKKQKSTCSEPLAIQFLQKLLEREPAKRYSALDALNDPFIQKYAQKPKIQEEDLKLLNTYQNKSVMEMALSSVFVHNLLPKEEQMKFIRVFRALDQNRNGRIPHGNLASSKIGNPKMDFEFSKLLIACVDLHDRDVLRRLFVFLDKDKDMNVNMEDVYELLEKYMDKQILDEIKEHFKFKQTRQLSYWDFDKMVKSF